MVNSPAVVSADNEMFQRMPTRQKAGASSAEMTDAGS